MAQYPHVCPMKRFVKCFFELLTQIHISAAGNGQKKGRITRLWTVRSRFEGKSYKKPLPCGFSCLQRLKNQAFLTSIA